MIGEILLDYVTGHFDGECAVWTAVILDTTERSISYTREYTSPTQLRAAVWFNIGHVDWVSGDEFERASALVFASAA